MFGRLFKKKQPPPAGQFLIARLNAKLQPMHRGGFFEDPLDAVLKKQSLGEVSGGGTKRAESGEIESCEIEIQVPTPSPEVVSLVASTSYQLGASKGSRLTIETTGEEVPFFGAEGLAAYLNGTDHPAETYRDCGSIPVHTEFGRRVASQASVT